MNKSLLFSQSKNALSGGIHFIASRNFSDVDFFQNVTMYDPDCVSNLEVYINGELTNQVANSIFANENDDVIIKAIDDYYPQFGSCRFADSPYINYIKSIEEPFPLMHQADGNAMTSFGYCFMACVDLTSIPQGLFDNNPQVTDFTYCFMDCSNLANIPEGLFDKNTQATNFMACFGYCPSLTSMPQRLFDNNTQVTDFSSCFYYCRNLTVNVQIGSIASSVDVTDFAGNTKEKGTVYCRAGSAAYNAFAGTSNANVNVLTY